MTIASAFTTAGNTPAGIEHSRTSRLPQSISHSPEITLMPPKHSYPWRVAVGLVLCAVTVPILFVVFLYCCERCQDW